MASENAGALQQRPPAEQLTIAPSVLYFGTPVALVTTRNPNGTANISPMSSVWALADRVVLGLNAGSQGRENAVRERELVVNFPSPELWRQVEAIARLTGRHPVPPEKAAIGYEFGPDKFARAELTPLASLNVRPPRIAECPIQIEAELVAAHDARAGAHSPRFFPFQILEARALAVHAHAAIVRPGTNHIDCGKWSPLLYIFRHYFACGRELGRTFKAEV